MGMFLRGSSTFFLRLGLNGSHAFNFALRLPIIANTSVLTSVSWLKT